MTDEERTATALRIYLAIAKNDGLTKEQAGENWRKLGPAGRSQWRLVAQAALQGMAPKNPLIPSTQHDWSSVSEY